jgi:hypothetical protein
MTVQPMLDMRHYKPGRFAYLMEKPFVKELWHFLTDENRVELMFSASQAVKPAIGPFLADLESRFGGFLSSPEYPKEEICVLVNNMIKQILEIQGFEHIACGLCRQGRYFKSSGVYRKRIEDQE